MTMTTDRLDASVDLLRDVVRTLHELNIPADRVSSLAVEHWYEGSTVAVHVTGERSGARVLVDRIADHYGLPDAGQDTTNYTRGKYLGGSPVLVYCGRPDA